MAAESPGSSVFQQDKTSVEILPQLPRAFLGLASAAQALLGAAVDTLKRLAGFWLDRLRISQ
jgi:hypothetical protein